MDNSEVTNDWPCSNDKPVKIEEDIKLNDDLLKEWTDEAEDVKRVSKYHRKKEGEIKCEDELDCNDASLEPKDVFSKIGDRNQIRDLCGQPNTKKFAFAMQKMIERLCEGAPLSERLFNSCVYKCTICSKSVLGWKELKRHSYGGTACKQKISLSNLEQLIQKVACLFCKLCSTKVLCDYEFLKRHLKTSHKIPLKEYISKFKIETSSFVHEGTYSNNFVGNLCLYECGVCKKQFDCKRQFFEHKGKTSHKTKTNIVKRVYHICRLCNKTCLCEIPLLERHLSTHSITLEKYCDNNNCTLDKAAIQKTLSQNNIKIREDAEKIIEKLCQKAPNSEKVTTMCRLKCSNCKKEFKSWDQVRRHFSPKSVAMCKRKISVINVAELITKVVCHICKICSAKTLCDSVFITKHLRIKHKMLLKEYIKKFSIDTAESSSNGSYSENIIGNLGQYKCDSCETKFCSMKSLREHKKSLSLKRDRFLEKIVYHKCKLCAKTILCEKIVLHMHFKQAHGINSEEYCKKN